MIALTLPMPPSVNGMYRNATQKAAVRAAHTSTPPKRPGRFKTGEYTAWQKEAGQLLNMQRPGHIGGAVEVTIRLPRKPRKPGSRAKLDVDNRIKPVLDLLVLHGVMDDDANVTRVVAEWFETDAKDASCEVRVRGLNVASRIMEAA